MNGIFHPFHADFSRHAKCFPCAKFEYESGRWWYYDMFTGSWWIGSEPRKTTPQKWWDILKELPLMDVAYLWNFYRLKMDDSEPPHDSESPVKYFLFPPDKDDPLNQLLAKFCIDIEEPTPETYYTRWYERRTEHPSFDDSWVHEMKAPLKDAISQVVDYSRLSMYLSTLSDAPETVLGRAKRDVFAFEISR